MLNEKEIVSTELNVLDGTITYAEDQIGYVPNVGNMNPGTQEKLIKISNSQRTAYQEYLIHAYGKAIRVRSEIEGEKIFRLSQSAAIFTDNNYQIATPNSSIGRLVSIARVGEERESNAWGEYEILDVWQFERYRGTDVITQRRNFSRMIGNGSLEFILVNLKRWLNEKVTNQREQDLQEKLAKLAQDVRQKNEQEQAEIIRQQKEEFRQKAEEQQKVVAREATYRDEDAKLEAEQQRRLAEEARRKKEEELLQALEDLEALEKEEGISDIFIDTLKSFNDDPQEEINLEHQPKIPEPQSIGLSTWFYVNLSEKQYDATHFGSKGLVVVEGVAGSGKTSVALGRTKSLLQLSQLPTTDERYTPDFDAQAQVGVVRTGELIQYLKDTCQELELHHFPVKEYSDIQLKLRHEWNLVGTKSGNKRFNYLPSLAYLPNIETCMIWASFVSIRMAELIKTKILSQLIRLNNAESPISLSMAVLKRINHIFQGKIPQKLHGFLANLSRLMNDAVDECFDKRVWLGWKMSDDAIHWLCVPDESPISLIMALPQPFCLANSRRHAVTLVIPFFGLLNWREWLPSKGSLVDQYGNPVSESTLEMAIEDKNFSDIKWKCPISNYNSEFEPIRRSGVKNSYEDILQPQIYQQKLKIFTDIVIQNNGFSGIKWTFTVSEYFDSEFEQFTLLNIQCVDDKLLCNQLYQQRLAIFNECKLVKLRRETGQYERERFYSYKKPYQIIDMPAVIRGDKNIIDLPKIRTFRSEHRNNVRNRLVSIFSNTINSPVGLYIETVIDKIDNESPIPSNDLKQIRKRLNDRLLADVDIDLLLLLTMELVYGAGKNPVIKDDYLIEPDYYAAVFIDEVQDFTEIQVRLMSMLANPTYRAVTVVGDMGQRLHRPSVSSLSSCFTAEQWGDSHHIELTENIRQSRVDALNWLSSSYRYFFINDGDNFSANPPDNRKGIEIYNVDVLVQPDQILSFLLEIPQTWTAVVVWPNQESAKFAADFLGEELAKGFIRTQFADHLDLSKRFMIHQTTPQHIKGLEFDYLMMVGTECYDLKDAIAINEVYVCLSRPIQQLVILGQLDQLDDRFLQLLKPFIQP